MDIGDKESREAMRYAWAGVEFAIIVVLFAVGGFWLDGALGTLPGFTALFSVVGLVWALYHTARNVMQFRRWLDTHQQDADRQENGNGRDKGDEGE